MGGVLAPCLMSTSPVEDGRPAEAENERVKQEDPILWSTRKGRHRGGKKRFVFGPALNTKGSRRDGGLISSKQQHGTGVQPLLWRREQFKVHQRDRRYMKRRRKSAT